MSIRGFLYHSCSELVANELRRHLSITGSVRAEFDRVAGLDASVVTTVEHLTVAVDGMPCLVSDPESALSAANIGRLFLREDISMLEQLCGAFALAIVDDRRKAAWLAIDRMGICRLTYAANSDGIVFGNRADVVAHAPGLPRSISNQRLYDYLFFHMIPAPETVFEGVRKLEPGTFMRWQDGNSVVRTYWRPDFTNQSSHPEAQFAEELRETLESAVRATNPDDRTGAFLSGGLDSSTVAGYLQRVAGRASTFSIGFGEPGYDELEYARRANEHFGCLGHEYNVTPQDVLELFPLIADAYDEPSGNSSAVPVLACARFAKAHGVDHLLAGDGGDELFAGNERYAKQKVFEAYTLIPASLRRGFLEPLVKRFDPITSIAPLRKLRSYVDQATTPLPERLETWNYVYREGSHSMLHPDFSAEIDLLSPVRQMNEIYSRVDAADFLDRLLVYDWHLTLSDSDLRKVSSMCELAGVRVSYPMLDQRLVDLSLRMPSNMKLRRMELRSLFKYAMKDILPKSILNKPKQGFGLPFGKWMKSNSSLADMIYERLLNLKTRRIFREGFIDGIIEQQKTGHHAYYGFFLWDLAMLEEWLIRHN